MSTLIKKVTSTISVVAVVASAVGSSIVSAASGFLPYAEALATAGYIQSSENEAGFRLADTASRQEVAGTALKLKLGTGSTALPANYSCKGYFTDVSATKPASWSCRAAELAADNGIVTKANASFRPTDNVTRAEALAMVLKAAGTEITPATASSFGDISIEWQKNVAEVALAKKIISANANFRPNDSVSRGELFVFAANALGLSVDDFNLDDILNGGDTTSTGTTSTGTTNPPVVVKAGDLNLSLNPASPTSGTQIPNTGIVRFAVVDFKAGSSDVSVNSVELSKLGLANIDTSTRVWFEKTGVRLSGKASFTSENSAVISFAPSLVVKAGATESLDLYIELSGATNGVDYQFASKAVDSSAQNVSGTFTTPVLRTTDYAVSSFTTEIAGTASTYKASTDKVEVGAFKISFTKGASTTNTIDTKLQSITLTQSGSADLTNLGDITLERNGVVVSTSARVDGKSLTFVVGDLIKEGATATYYVKAKINNVEQTSDVYNLRLKNTSDVNVIEAQTGFRAVTSTIPTLNVYTVTGGDVKFERNASTALSANYAPGTQNVVLMEGSITAKNAVRLEDIRLTYTTGGSITSAAAEFNTIYLVIGTSVFSASAPTSNTVDFNGIVTVSGTVPVKLYANLKDNALIGTIKFNEMKLDSFITTKEYVSNSEAVSSSVGTIAGVNVTVDATALNVTRNDGLGNTNLAAGSKSVVLYGANLSSSKGNPINITSASFDFTGSNTSTSTGHLNNTYATLYVDGVAVSSKTVDQGTIKFEGFNAQVSTTKAVTLQVKADLSDSFASGTINAKLSALTAVDAATSKDASISALPTGATFTIQQATAVFAVSDSNPQSQLFLAGSSNNKLFAFKATAKNDNIKLKDVSFTGTQLAKFTNFRLTDAAGTVIANSSVADENGVTFTSVPTGNTINMDASATFYVIADANTNENATGVVVYLSSAVITASNGTDLSSVTVNAGTNSKTHAVAENTAVIAKAANASKLITTSALRFTVAASGKDLVTLNTLSFNNQVSGYTGSMVVKVYKNSIDANNLAGTGTVADSSIDLDIGTNNTVDAGNTVTYIVVVEGAIIDSTSNSQDWSISLTDVAMDTNGTTAGGVVNAASYYNVGQFPITEVK